MCTIITIYNNNNCTLIRSHHYLLSFSLFSHPSSDHPGYVVEVPLYPTKDVTYDMNITTFVAKPGR